MKHPWKTTVFLGLLALAGTGCGQSASPDITDSTTDAVSAIEQTLDDEEHSPLFTTDVFVGDQVGNNLIQGVSTDPSSSLQDPAQAPEIDPTLLPQWYREITDIHRDVDIHIENEISYVEVTADLAGLLHLDMDGDGNYGTKAIQSVAHRLATFKKIRPRHWRLIELSPIEFSLKDQNHQTVHIQQVTATVNGEVRWEVSDPETLFPFPSGLPLFSPGEEVVVTAKITNQNPDGTERESRVYLHHDRRREPMFDDGTHGDEVAGDGIFTKTKTVGEALGLHRAAVDALDAEMFSDETTQNYNATGWTMPYIVTRSYTGTMHHLNIEGGCWKFVTEDGESFEPRGDPPDLYQDGLRVTLLGFPRPGLVTLCQVGPVMKVVNFKIQP
jgi:hypothetical protein